MNECNIVKDLMPLYADELLSPDSLEFIEDHVSKCPQCRDLWDRRNQELPDIHTQNPISASEVIIWQELRK